MSMPPSFQPGQEHQQAPPPYPPAPQPYPQASQAPYQQSPHPQAYPAASYQQAPQAYPQAYPQQAMPAQPVLQCRFCGCVPAAKTKFRGHRGMIILMTFLSSEGPFCRDCGLSTFRRMTSETLLAGWWGAMSFFITPLTVLLNLTRHGKVASLPPPSPPPAGPYERPMDPGAPLLRRPGGIFGVVIAAGFVLLILAALVSDLIS
ncbi:hypothetical protein [Flindersiella endophytica]